MGPLCPGRSASHCPRLSDIGSTAVSCLPDPLHALIDGIFAIAVTPLVLDLPRLAGPEQFLHRLSANWPSYAAYLISFASIGVVWIEHHGMMSPVRFVNRRFLERTLLFLLFISIIPWPTALAAEHVTMMVMGLSMALSWRYPTRHEQLVYEPARPAIRAGARRALLGALAYLRRCPGTSAAGRISRPGRRDRGLLRCLQK
jgi:uncharacterized membrane protein